MSSPMSSLKKSKKTPMAHYPPGSNHTTNSGNVPFRHRDDALLEDVTTRMIGKYVGSPSVGSTPDSKGTPSDIDLMQSMISRIALLESQLQLQAKQLNDKDKRINVLEEKCRLYQRVSSEQAQAPNYTRELETKCTILQKQISEMEDFLLDYGMVWVGNDDMIDDDEDGEVAISEEQSGVSMHGGTWNQRSSIPCCDDVSNSLDNPFDIDFDRLISNIQELNLIAGDGESRIEKTASGARFKAPEAVQLILYKNGLVMFDGPFRSYEDQVTRICLTDFLDGYFPSELQQRYPDGVAFKVLDQRDVVYSKSAGLVAFSGGGQQLGGETLPSKLIPSTIQTTSKSSTEQKIISDIPGTKLTADQFLSQLPSSVVRGGRVIDIRNSLADAIKGTDRNCQVTVIETEAMTEIKDRLDMDESVRPPSGKFTTLRIKDSDNHTYVLKMRYTDTIGDVKSYLTKQRKTHSNDFELVTTFPSRTYDKSDDTLFDCGLTPNATIHIRPKK